MKQEAPSYERYRRQVMLPGFGIAGQQKLSASKLLVIGAGGLGCAALQYLVAAGVGNIGVLDDDIVSLSNLHRQVLYATFDTGLPKAERAAQILTRQNPDTHITVHHTRINAGNALDLIRPYDLVVDGSDNFPTRYLVNDACVLLGKPLVYGAVSQFEGQVAVFNCSTADGRSANYRHLFPQPTRDGEILNCAEAGVLGVLPGIIGTMQANEAIKLLTGLGKPLINSLLTYNALNNEVYEFLIDPGELPPGIAPHSEEQFRAMDYELACSLHPAAFEIDADQFASFAIQRGVAIVDLREPGELPELDVCPHKKMPFSSFREQMAQIEENTVILVCQSGQRSRQAAGWMAEQRPDKNIYSLSGGVVALSPGKQERVS